MRAWIVLLLSTVALAGCSGEIADPTTDADHDPHTDGGNHTMEANITLENVTNSPPMVNFTTPSTALVAGESVAFQVNVTDVDGDAISWYVAIDDVQVSENGTQNGTYNHVFDVEGIYQVTLNATDGMNYTTSNITVTVEVAVDPNAPEDRGWYMFDPVTSICQVKSFTAYGGTIYTSALGGGTWVLAEANGLTGLQIADDHPSSGTGAGFEVAGAEDCVDGDLILI